ncbi:uncharacterized protein LOC126881247 [Diabrotica virgifera virgifera]|uniref:Uncharacterized protein n=1 Tax=Diabrotica virgifera virgifera TaxID=50390 RepID=A0ABM5JTU1_DIAVI|nr:uncharacterized protein LOC126881247 [Diabrotica virgifera virgifera]
MKALVFFSLLVGVFLYQINAAVVEPRKHDDNYDNELKQNLTECKRSLFLAFKEAVHDTSDFVVQKARKVKASIRNKTHMVMQKARAKMQSVRCKLHLIKSKFYPHVHLQDPCNMTDQVLEKGKEVINKTATVIDSASGTAKNQITSKVEKVRVIPDPSRNRIVNDPDESQTISNSRRITTRVGSDPERSVHYRRTLVGGNSNTTRITIDPDKSRVHSRTIIVRRDPDPDQSDESSETNRTQVVTRLVTDPRGTKVVYRTIVRSDPNTKINETDSDESNETTETSRTVVVKEEKPDLLTSAANFTRNKIITKKCPDGLILDLSGNCEAPKGH